MSKYSNQQWLIFGEVVQNRKGVRQVAEEQELSIEFVRETMAMWHREEPKLFPAEFKRSYMKRHVNLSRRQRENIKIVSYDAKTKHGGELRDDIRQKF